MSKLTKIGILGCGTVGSGLVNLLPAYPGIHIEKIFVKNAAKDRGLTNPNLNGTTFTTNIDDVLENPEIDIVVEVMGGVDGTKPILLKALENGKNIVTANKDLLAIEGEELFEKAKQKNLTIQYEAAVAGGIPIINTLKQSLRGNKINRLFGIINGTTNYMLTAMEREGVSFDDILKRAQDLGYAESDPTSDVEGHDAKYKIAILASIISGKRVDISKVFCEGIRNVSLNDIKSAAKRNYRIKLLGIADNSEKKLDIRVHPVMVPLDNPLASVHGADNAILVHGDAVGELTLIGKGAGSLPTASSVLGDVLMIASQINSSSEPNPQQVCEHSAYAEIKDIKEVKNGFYVRISMFDRVGVLRDLGEITSKHSANVRFIDQYDAKNGEALADFIVTPIVEKDMQGVIADLKKLESIKEIQSVIRVLD